MMNEIKFIFILLMMLTTSNSLYAEIDASDIRMPAHCPGGKGCPTEYYSNSEEELIDVMPLIVDGAIDNFDKSTLNEKYFNFVSEVFGSVNMRVGWSNKDEYASPFAIIAALTCGSLNEEKARELLKEQENRILEDNIGNILIQRSRPSGAVEFCELVKDRDEKKNKWWVRCNLTIEELKNGQP